MLRSFRVFALLLGISAACDGNVILDSGDGDDGSAQDDEARPDARDETSDAEGSETEDVQPDTELDVEGDTDACTLACVGRECGDDGCGGTCGPGCGPAETCTAEGFCQPTGETWVRLPAGTFLMGSPPSEAGRGFNETQHTVTLTHPFLVQSTEVTQTQFALLMGYNPSFHTDCPDCPVEQITWYEAAAYCNALSAANGREPCYWCDGSGPTITCVGAGPLAPPYDCEGYRLPTEAEWEYAARAGDNRATYNGDLDPGRLACETPNPVLDPIAWYCGNSGSATHVVRAKTPNAWNLSDMLGNLWEWCHDYSTGLDYDPLAVADPVTYDGTDYALRGGCWARQATFVRAASRTGAPPSSVYFTSGCRPVRSQQP